MGYSRDFLLNIGETVRKTSLSPDAITGKYIADLGINVDNTAVLGDVYVKTRRGVRAGKKRKRPISVLLHRDGYVPEKTRGVCSDNLIHIQCEPLDVKYDQDLNISMCLINARSVRNKADEIVQYIIENDIDVCVVTETWLTPDDQLTVREITPTGYATKCVCRENRRGGGIAIIFRQTCCLKVLEPSVKTNAFESLEAILKTPKQVYIRLVVVYRPPTADPALGYSVPLSVFFDDFNKLVDEHVTSPNELVILGDFNLHVDCDTNVDAKKFIDLLDDLDMHQHINEPTHKDGHILDLLITRKCDVDFVRDISVDCQISDHNAILFKAKAGKPPPLRKLIKYRKYRSIDMEKFKTDISSDISTFLEQTDDLDVLVNKYNSGLKEVLDTHAPEQQRTVTVRHHTPWYNDTLREEKKLRRSLEKKWRKSRLEEDRKSYQTQRQKVVNMVTEHKTVWYNDLIDEKAKDPKGLFNVIDSLLHKEKQTPYPEHDSAHELAEEFANFFIDKIETIRKKFVDAEDANEYLQEREVYTTVLDSFKPATMEEIRKIVLDSPTKSSDLDPLPTWILKSCIDEVLPLLVKIVNISFSTATMSDSLKIAAVQPLLKKAILDLILKNYRPVSNLTFLSKLIERVVAKRFVEHQNQNSSQELFQSAYRRGHGTETALLLVKNDNLLAMASGEISLQILLDLSAAFDTIDHTILLRRLSERIGIRGDALAWFKSYLSNRCQYVIIEGDKSNPKPLNCGVPQGSVLGPILFSAYMSPLGDIIRKHDLSFHIYADDTQLYMSFKPKDQAEANEAVIKLEKCLVEIKEWMSVNKLKLNEDKTEFMIIGTRQQCQKVKIPHIEVNGHQIVPSTSVRNLGIMFDCNMTMNTQVKAIRKSGHYHLRNIRTIRPFLTRSATETVVHAYVSSRLDSGNALLYGITKTRMHQLQKIQNMAARVITKTRKFDHITPALIELHWLPVAARVEYKILCFVYKSLAGTAPQYLTDLLTIHEPKRTLRSACQNKIVLQEHFSKSVTCGDASFTVAGPILWNRLPVDIQAAPSLDSFKKRLKTHLFKKSY